MTPTPRPSTFSACATRSSSDHSACMRRRCFHAGCGSAQAVRPWLADAGGALRCRGGGSRGILQLLQLHLGQHDLAGSRVHSGARRRGLEHALGVSQRLGPYRLRDRKRRDSTIAKLVERACYACRDQPGNAPSARLFRSQGPLSSSSNRMRWAAPSRSSYWPERRLQMKAARPSPPRKRATGIFLETLRDPALTRL
jgi:hypothetical protein